MADGKVTIDTEVDQSGAEKGISKLKGNLNKLGGVAKGAISAGTAIGKAFVAGTAAAATGVAALASKATAAYGAYEQMAGGVSTLFGTNEMSLDEYAKSQGKAVNEVRDQYHQLEFAQNLVMENARKAYKTAGLSMNEYMNNVTSFAAALKQSTADETEAARVADRAMIDMSDNANKMGTNMEDIQHAYQGFAKQNYTMLDNLKLGYGGTKTEMERLVKDAAAMTDVQKDLNVTVEEGSLDFGNIINAISVMQKSLGIAGTTSKEAASTIEGSLNSMKGSWENLLTILADPDATDKDISDAINDLVQTAETYITNILPVFEKAITGISTLINRLVPVVMEKIPSIINENLPILLEAAIGIITSLTKAFADNLPKLIQILNNAVNMLLEQLPGVLSALGKGLLDSLPLILEMLMNLMITLVQMLAENAGNISEFIVQILLAIVNIITENLGTLIEAGIKIVLGLIEGITQSLPQIIEAMGQIINALLDATIEYSPQLIEAAGDIIAALVEGLILALPELLEALPEIIIKMTEVLLQMIPMLVDVGIELIRGLLQGIVQAIPELISKIPEMMNGIINSVKSAFGVHSPSTVFADIGANLILGLWNGISDKVAWVKEKIGGVMKGIVNKAKEVFGVHSPSKEFEWIGKMNAEGLNKGFDKNNPIDTIQNELKYGMGKLNNAMNLSANSAYENIQKGSNLKVSFDVQGDPYNIFRVVQRENTLYNKMTGMEGFA